MRQIALLSLILFGLACSKSDSNEGNEQSSPPLLNLENLADGLYARIETNRGDVLCRLTYQQTPMTVANFVALAEGSIENSVKPMGEPYYDGIIFHRVVNDFMVQGGEPNTLPGGIPSLIGRGNPGYYFPDEFRPELTHNTAGTLSMANMGKNTNGSQFFITHKATPWLDGVHSVFGYVVRNLPVVYQIQQGDTMRHVEIIRQGADAEAFDPSPYFDQLRQNLQKIR